MHYFLCLSGLAALRDHLVYDAVFHTGFGVHEEVTVGVAVDGFEWLAGVVGKDAV